MGAWSDTWDILKNFASYGSQLTTKKNIDNLNSNSCFWRERVTCTTSYWQLLEVFQPRTNKGLFEEIEMADNLGQRIEIVANIFYIEWWCF